ncbi:MAG: PilZ domain-containing protein [Acidimicrobiales bacterium]
MAEHDPEAPAGGDASTPETGDHTIERRQSPRFRVTLDASYRRLGHDDADDQTRTIDVSHGGARIAAPSTMSVGDVLQLVVQMPHGIELTLQGLVVQISDTEGQHAHVAFDSLSAAAADLLTELLQEQAERQAAASDAAEKTTRSDG